MPACITVVAAGLVDPGVSGSNAPNDVKANSWVMAVGRMRSPSPI
jgi:hypothetical protein